MSKEEYLGILQSNLRNVPPEEAWNIMEYYREYFEDAGPDNVDRVIQELGAPQILAKKVTADYAIKGMEERQNNKTRSKGDFSNMWLILLAAIGSPVWVPLAFALVVVVASVVFAIAITCIAVAAGGVLGIVLGIPTLIVDIPTGILTIGSGAVCVGIGILLFIGVVALAKQLKKLFLYIAKKKIRKENNDEKKY
jgi:uncharacterized membrane protein